MVGWSQAVVSYLHILVNMDEILVRKTQLIVVIASFAVVSCLGILHGPPLREMQYPQLGEIRCRGKLIQKQCSAAEMVQSVALSWGQVPF
jgi:hypothetical protein